MLLDCTFRDGGYQTDWIFDEQLVSDYLTLGKCLKHVEIGYVQQGSSPFNNVQPKLLQRFRESLPESKLYLMSDRPQLLSRRDVRDKYQRLDCDCVRVAIDFNLVEGSRFIFEELKELGFETSLNISKFYLLNDFTQTMQMLDSWECLDIIYLADSFGSIYPEELKSHLHICFNETEKKIGFHGHDSQGLAAYNSLMSFREGAYIVDSTMAGMGKGSGNAATEELLEHFDSCPKDIVALSLKFHAVKKGAGWGKDFMHFMAARHQVNPTYIQKMLQMGLEPQSILEAIPKLEGEISYRDDVLYHLIHSDD